MHKISVDNDDESLVFPWGNLGKDAQTERIIGDNLTRFLLVTEASPEREDSVYML